MLSISQVQSLGGYKIIYADPAWMYNDKGCQGAADNHYATMSGDSLRALPVQEIAAKHCALFIWVVNPLLDEAIDLVRAWGFKFKTKVFEWVKYYKKSHRPFYGTGRFTRAATESCWLATRGNPRPVCKDQSQLVETIEDFEVEVFQGCLGPHSRKPLEIRERIEIMMGKHETKIELFARERVEGWDAWGDDLGIGTPDVSLTGKEIIHDEQALLQYRLAALEPRTVERAAVQGTRMRVRPAFAFGGSGSF